MSERGATVEGVMSGRITVRLVPRRGWKALERIRGMLGGSLPEHLEFSSRSVVSRDWDLISRDSITTMSHCIELGTGCAGTSGGAGPSRCACPAGRRVLDRDYPAVTCWEDRGVDQTIVTYGATFPPGSMKVPRGGIEVTELCLCPENKEEEDDDDKDDKKDKDKEDKGKDSALAYGWLREPLSVRPGDMLRVTVELTYSQPKAADWGACLWPVT